MLCLAESIVTYSAPRGEANSALEDLSYDGSLDGGYMRGGLGQLVDGIFGDDHIQEPSPGGSVEAAVYMKMSVFRNVAPCTLADVERRFRGANCCHNRGKEYCTVQHPSRQPSSYSCTWEPEVSPKCLWSRRKRYNKMHFTLIACSETVEPRGKELKWS